MPTYLKALASAMCLAICALVTIPAHAQAAAAKSCPALLKHTFPKLQDDSPQPLCQYAGKVVLVVNTASYCGFTYQYQGLEALYEKYKGKGLVVLGFPSNDFFQEKSSNKEIADFCFNTYGVAFPMFSASSVKGDKANPLYKALSQRTGKAPGWNFYKYLIDRAGNKVFAYDSRVEPTDKKFLATLETLLAEAP